MVDLLNTQSYMAYYYGIRKSCRSDAEAYEIVETQCNEMYGVGMYENFGAFRIAMHRYKGKVYEALHHPTIPDTTVRDILTVSGYMAQHRKIKYQENGNVLSDEVAFEILEADIMGKYDLKYCNDFNAFRQLKRRHTQAMMKKIQRSMVYEGKRNNK